jgi:hypothetical protein
MTNEIRVCLHEIASEEAEDLYKGAEGLWASKDQIPTDPSEFSEAEYEKLISPERLEEINNGEEITKLNYFCCKRRGWRNCWMIALDKGLITDLVCGVLTGRDGAGR